MNTTDAKRVLETALICTQQPIAVKDLSSLFQDQVGIDTIKLLLSDLQLDWRNAGWNWFMLPAVGGFKAGLKCGLS